MAARRDGAVLEEVLRTRCLLEADRPLVAGISGGPDSLCLLGILHAAGYQPIVAHFNHKLRLEADLEARAVEKHALEMGLPFASDSADVGGWAAEHSLSIEEASRNLRYRFLFRVAREHGAQAVAVGHTADDQVETVLMHFLRGAGLAGLKGMPYRLLLPDFDPSIPLIRPLLSLWRTDTEAYSREHRLNPHIDSSNLDQTYFRNHLRHTLIPELEKYNPRFKEALTRTAFALQGDHELVQAALEEKWEQVVAAIGDGWIAFERQALMACSPGLQMNLLRRAGELLRPESRDIGYETLERAVHFIQDPAGRQVDFVNGLYLFSEDSRIILAGYQADLVGVHQVQLSGELTLDAGQEVRIGKGWVLSSRVNSPGENEWEKDADPWAAWLDLDKTGERLLVRARRQGDDFQPLGMGGQTVKVREFFINQKIPRRARAAWPLICAGETIAWIPGLRIAHPFRVTDKSAHVLKLTLKIVPEEN